MVSTGSLSSLLGISANVIPVGSWEPLAFLASGTFWWLLPVPHLPLLHTSVSDYVYITGLGVKRGLLGLSGHGQVQFSSQRETKVGNYITYINQTCGVLQVADVDSKT